jgi:predicted metalloprotease with PDZ domain
VQRAPGRTVQSVADSSFDAWIKYYRQDENSPNAIVSYYAKGALVALAIDLAVRARTGGRASLDDAMRAMWTRHGRDFYAADGGPGPGQSGLAEDAFPGLLREATGVSLGPQIARWVDGTDELPLARLLARVGVTLTFAAADASPSLGVRTATRGADLAIATAYTGGAAQRAGLSAGDTIVAVDGLRVDEKSLKALLSRRRPGDVVAIHAFRRDELMRFEATLDAPPRSEASLVEAPGEHALRRGWLGSASGPIGAAAPRPTGAHPSRADRSRSGSRSSAARR